MFNIEQAIQNWKRQLRRSPAFEDGDIAELESHLREEIGRLKAEGVPEEEAFQQAVEDVGEPESIGDELYKSRATQKARPVPPWKQKSWVPMLLPNYLKIAWRNLRKNPGYSFINIFGLAVGLAACILIGLYVQDELSSNDFHKKNDRIYRVLREFDLPDLHATITGTPSLLAPTLEQNMAAIKKTVRIQERSPIVQQGMKTFVEDNFFWVDAGFFDVFSFPILRGKADLARPGTVVLTEAMATKYFPNKNPVGQTLDVGGRQLEVTGVMADVPKNSSLRFDFVGSLTTVNPRPTWSMNGWETYIMLAEGTSKRKVMPQVAQVIQTNVAGNYEKGSGFIPHLQPLSGIHLGQGVSVKIYSAGNILYVYLFVALAIFILLLACINFMNLTTARSTERANEVGMRKALGAQRKQLAGQFLGETVLMSLLALGFALVLCWLALPLFNSLAGKALAFDTIFGGWRLLTLLGLVVFVGILAGSYPALMLSGFEPIRALRDKFETGGSAWLRKALVVFQFTLSIVLIAGTAIVFQQLSFMTSKELGFSQENLVVVEQAGYLGEQKETFMQELKQLSDVRYVATAISLPGSFSINSMWRPATPGTERQNMNYKFVGWNYIETLGIKMVAGRVFSRAFATDSFSVILNEVAAQDFGWTAQKAIGKKIERGSDDFTVVGVAKNFHYESLHAEIYPLLLFPPIQRQNRVAVRVVPGNVPQTLKAIGEIWEKFSELPFRYSFLAENLAFQYRSEQRLAKVFGLFTGLALLIACLGLFGLAAYASERRTKEIGIRKAMGATISSIVRLLSKDFLKLVLIGFVIAVPIAWYFMHQWLQDFAYRIEIGPGIFLMAGIAAVLIALATVSWQSIRAALTNPVDSLRSE